MAVKYEITYRTSPLAERAMSHVVKYRAPAAHDALYKAVWEMLDAHGLRDRPIALELVKRVEACDVLPPAMGHYRHGTFKLYQDNPLSPYVEFWAQRV